MKHCKRDEEETDVVRVPLQMKGYSTVVFNCCCKSSQWPLAGHTVREQAPKPQQQLCARHPPHLTSAIDGKWGPGESSQTPLITHRQHPPV